MGLAYAGLKQYPDAVKAFKAAARLQPEMGLIYENLGVVYIKMGQWREARDALAEAIRLAPDSPEAHYNLGLVNGKLIRTRKPGPSLPKPSAWTPPWPRPTKTWGWPTSTWDSLDAARKSLKEAVRLDPKDAQAHYALCVYYARTGDAQAANREFQALKQLDPKLAEKLSNLMRPGAPRRSRKAGGRLPGLHTMTPMSTVL